MENNKGRNIQTYKPGKPIEQIKRDFKLKEVFKLASNEIPFSPQYITKRVLKEISNINRYPESDCFYLRRDLARKLGVAEKEIVFGNGSDEIIVLLLRAFINNSRDEVIVAYPTFLIYEIQSRIERAKVIRVPLKNFRYDLSAMAARITDKTKIIFVANPDNPTGTYVSHQEVRSFLENIPKKVIVYFDEAYFEFVDRKDFPKTLDFLKRRGNIVVSRTFSKAYGLAGLRLGYAITDENIAEILNKVREPFNVNRIAQVAGIAALKNRGFLRKVVEYIKKEKEFLYREFDRLGLNFVRSVTNFILVEFNYDVSQLSQYLLRQGVVIREMSAWGLPNYFRITVGLHRENKMFIMALRKYLSMYKKKGVEDDYRV